MVDIRVHHVTLSYDWNCTESNVGKRRSLPSRFIYMRWVKRMCIMKKENKKGSVGKRQ